MSTARFYLDFSKCWRITGAVSQRCAQFCLCWCLGRLHWIHGIFTCLKLGTWSYHQDFKNVIFFGVLAVLQVPFLLLHSVVKLSELPSLHCTGENVQIPPLLSNAEQHHLHTPASKPHVRCTPGVPGLCPKLFAKAGLFLHLFMAVCLARGRLARPLPAAAGKVGGDPEKWWGAGFGLRLLLLSPPKSLRSPRGGGSWM